MIENDAVKRRLDDLFGDEFAPGGAFDLSPLRDALHALGDPHDKLPRTIHIAGTNGKGSTCAFLRAIAEAQGVRVHAFTKPHLLKTRERVRLAGALVSDDAFLAAIDRVAQTKAPLRHFEAQLAAALLLFAETPADLLILETGVGGTHDATNVIAKPAATIVTPIAADHAALLGSHIAEIAAHKAGILKKGAHAIVTRQTGEAQSAIEARAEKIGAPLLRAGQEWDAFAQNERLIVQTQRRLFDLPLPSLPGVHQIENAGAAVVALDQIIDLTDEAAAKGVTSARHPARMERLPSERGELWLDGAHNPHAALALARTLDDLARRAPRHVVLIVGMLARKDAAGFLSPLASKADSILTTPIAGQDSISGEVLARLAATNAQPTASLEQALNEARARSPDARIVVCGSLALAAEAYRLYGLTVD
ncbi:MAG: folylpolyglutamate synthase/dihydrofolate synthase family protein [Hyphomonadaceae bacterium]